MMGKINLEGATRKVTGLAGDFVQKEKGYYFTSIDVLEQLSQAIKWAEDF